ncbi:hypothetical protein IW262DRAFT_1278976 [Armillaria fumosa]|nr:hypothetical protein IW262DRAFT_1278976 [Armillaria fumosa]
MASQESDASDEEDDSEVILQTELVWDDADSVYRCPKCHYEVIDGVCQGCATFFKWTEEQDEMLGEAAPTDENCAMSLDRVLVRRGTTPLDVLPPNLPVPDTYVNSPTEFQSLMRRGATVAMCLRYKLRFTRKHGIVARADEDLFDLVGNPAMEETDEWKIYLGRRIRLHSNDEDGREFLIDLLEDALIYPLRSEFSNWFAERWETFVKDPSIYPVVWITRPMSKSGPAGAANHEDPDDSADEGDDVPDFEYEEDDMEGADGDLDEAGAENDAENSVGEYEMDGETDEEGDETTSGTVVVRQEDDIAGSDFDSDEELSGDEFVMGWTV